MRVTEPGYVKIPLVVDLEGRALANVSGCREFQKSLADHLTKTKEKRKADQSRDPDRDRKPLPSRNGLNTMNIDGDNPRPRKRQRDAVRQPWYTDMLNGPLYTISQDDFHHRATINVSDHHYI
jgi:hypothetical protein